MRILIADDNAQNRYMLEQLLTGSGHQCVSAAHGREALDLARAGRFDAVVSDILMPVMDGFQFCRELKADPALAAVPFIFYTATYTEPGDIEFGLQLGAAHYLLKPAEPAVILAALANLTRPPAAAPAGPPQDEYLAQYNARLIQKLESKMIELERANADLLKTNVALSDEVGRRRAAERAAAASSALQRATLESTADGILAVDADGFILAWNRAFLELWPLPPGQTPPRSFGELVDLLSQQAAEPGACALEWRTAGAAGPVPAIITLADGRVFERLHRPLDPGDGRPGRVWTFRDVTERHRAEEGRRALQAQLFELQKMEALGVLAGGIAHDFNNILTAILGQNALAQSLVGEGSPAGESLRAVQRAGERAADLVRQILTFSRHQEPQRQVLRIEAVIRDALKLADSTLPAGVQVETRFGPDVPLVKVDPTQMHQVLMNLVTNANHAMKGQGRLRVATAAADVPAGGASGLPPGRYALISITDTGPGIDERIRHRIFDPFFTTKPPGQGTGLGLAVVHGIITGYGGHITVRNAPGAGAEFQLHLPAAGEVAETAAPAPAAGLQAGGGELILVAEDDPGVREFVRTLLGRLGYRCDVCESAEEALARFAQQPAAYALALTDLSMAGMSGTALARELRRRRPGLPVVIMTGYFSTEELEQERAAQEFELLLKPCSAESLSEALARTLRAPVRP